MMRDGECRGVVSLFFALYFGGEPVCFLPSRLSYRVRLHAFYHLGPAMVHPTLLVLFLVRDRPIKWNLPINRLRGLIQYGGVEDTQLNYDARRIKPRLTATQFFLGLVGFASG
jgi:hypothetical protein